MKAFLLAAGYGTRLKPLTDKTPKCLVPICGKPLFWWWMQLFLKYKVKEILVNTHYLSEQVRYFINDYNNKSTGIKIKEFYEPILLGSGGTVASNREFVAGEDSCLICYADNLTNINLGNLMVAHKKNNGILTMALFRTNTPEQCGIAKLDDAGKIVSFVEKPKQPESNLANAGIYVVDKEIFNYIPNKAMVDFGKDVLPLLIGKMYGYEISDYLLDIGTVENYQRAQEEWQNDNNQNTTKS